MRMRKSRRKRETQIGCLPDNVSCARLRARRKATLMSLAWVCLSPRPRLFEIHPVTGTLIDTQLRNTLTDRLNVARVAQAESFDPRLDARPRLQISQAIEPFGEEIGLADLDHLGTVAVWLHTVKVRRQFTPDMA